MVLLMVTTCSFNQFLLRNLHKTSSHSVSKCLTSIWHTRVMSEPFLRIRSVGGGGEASTKRATYIECGEMTDDCW